MQHEYAQEAYQAYNIPLSEYRKHDDTIKSDRGNREREVHGEYRLARIDDSIEYDLQMRAEYNAL